MNYKEVTTKTEYRELLDNLKEETKKLVDKFPEITIYKSIYNQIIDIIKRINNKEILSEQEIYQQYSIGAIAVKNFDCDKDIYGRKLQDAFGALFEYWNLPER